MNEPNRLIQEKSPYLLQHAYNPVDWHPWGDAAFEKARKEDKPIFLSIGYSTCHWCHVMERESFEEEEVAYLLNEWYVPVKVDREERPDVDNLYMTVCQALTGHGGWPLTVILTPEKKPFFAGTYFPKTARYGQPGLMDVLQRVGQVWKDEREKAMDVGERITQAIQTELKTTESGVLSEEMLKEAYNQFASSFDEQWGGFGPEPKFPRPHDLLFLLRYWKQNKEEKALEMVEGTLEAMRRGGIYDHVGFGFARYSVDKEWLVPHFEKMLYDNALLAYAYLEAFQVTRKETYAQTVREIFTYVLRDMTDAEGGFYSAEDADSEGVEGKFYVWTPAEVTEILGEQEGTLFCSCFDITADGNFEGHSIPNLIGRDLPAVAEEHGLNEEELARRLEAARKKLFEAREQRIHPHKDDKVLTSWNGLMIAALAKGARVLGEERYAEAAGKAAIFIRKRLTREDGRLLARWRDGEAAIPAYVDDYANLAWGLIELYEATFEPDHLKEALKLSEAMLDLFGDEKEGGFFFYGKDGEELLTRTKETYDGATPSGNSVAALNLIRLARFTGDPEWESRAETQLKAFAGSVKKAPIAYSFYLTALQFALGDPMEIVISGHNEDEITQEMIRLVQKAFLPGSVLLYRPEGKAEEITHLVPYTAEQHTVDRKPAAYICRNFACERPVTLLTELETKISE
ncbi:thioredoxin domain-containing protein [Salinithrix halophila]|uniref:Thioredoxin domain-containing protein n=1 Tax=Salinithrix halophila TaxID=1485204 RepID=A0ABV8JDR7_9BACL